MLTKAGIASTMITGDNINTGSAIAINSGILANDSPIFRVMFKKEGKVIWKRCLELEANYS